MIHSVVEQRALLECADSEEAFGLVGCSTLDGQMHLRRHHHPARFADADSIGGLVTWAKRCLNVARRRRCELGWRARQWGNDHRPMQ